MKIIGYIRVSTEKQAENNTSLELQRKTIVSFAAVNGITVDEWIQDVESGGTLDREGLNYLVEQVEAGQVKQVIVAKLDRLSRDVTDGTAILKSFEKQKVDVVSVAEYFDKGPIGQLMKSILLAFAEYEKSMIKVRTNTAHKDNVAKTGRTWSATGRMYGYNYLKKGLLEINVEDVSLIKDTFRLYDETESMRQTALELHKLGYRNKNGAYIRHMTVSRIIKRRDFYMKKIHLNPSIKLHDGVVPAQPKLLEDV